MSNESINARVEDFSKSLAQTSEKASLLIVSYYQEGYAAALASPEVNALVEATKEFKRVVESCSPLLLNATTAGRKMKDALAPFEGEEEAHG